MLSQMFWYVPLKVICGCIELCPFTLQTIGKGNFAKVKRAIHVITGVEVAVKIIDKVCMF
jgi:hypothetical protein